MITDNDKVDTVEEVKICVSNKLNHVKQVMTQTFSGLAYMLPNAIEGILPYNDSIKEFNHYAYFAIIILHVSFTAYFAYKTMMNKEVKEKIEEVK